jgi:DNA sulfur modification protein DndD
MLLQKLKLVNFRQFYSDATVIEFSTDIDKNITLIHGENGIGKTTILNAILWCLYEKLTHDFENPDELICLQSLKEGNKSCRVELNFEYEGKEYLAQRSLQNSNKSLFKLFEVSNSNYSDVPNPKAFINSILPDDMAEYFFFHGEGISNINAKKSGEKFKRAIRDILGFRLAETAVEDLKEINRKWTKELANLQNLSKEQSQLIGKKKNIEEKITILKVKQIQLSDDEEINQNDLNKVLGDLRNCSNLDAKTLQKEIDILTSRGNRVESIINQLNVDKQGLIQKYGWIIFGQKLAHEGLGFIDEQSLKAKLPAPYDETLVKDLIKDGKCICGRELNPGTDEYSKVISLVEKADNAVIRSKLMKSRSAGTNMKGRFSDFLSGLEKIEKNLTKQDTDKRDISHELVEKQETLDGIAGEVDEVKKLEQSKNNCTSALSVINQKIGSNDRSLGILNSELQTTDLKLKKFGAEDVRISRLTGHQSYAQELIELCGVKLDQYEKDSKLTIAKKVNETLQEFSRKDFKVKVGDDFSFYLVREDGHRVAKSKGENLLLNLSFVSALIEFAQMRSGASGDFLVSGTTAPFVIDAPFGELDNTYKRATAEFLPKRSRQLIFLLSSSHWIGTVNETINKKIGSEYVLVSSKRSIQNGKPDDKLMIDGKEYIQSLYNQEKDATFIEKVR